MVLPLDFNPCRAHEFVATNEGFHFFEGVTARHVIIIGILKEAEDSQGAQHVLNIDLFRFSLGKCLTPTEDSAHLGLQEATGKLLGVLRISVFAWIKRYLGRCKCQVFVLLFFEMWCLKDR